MNEVEIILTGNVGDTPQLWKNTPRAFARMNVACTPRIRQDGEWTDAQTQWVQVKTWGKLAENTALSIRKGDAVIVKGSYRLEEYTNPEGVVYKTAVIFASAVGFDLRRTRAVAVNVRTDDADPQEKSQSDPHRREGSKGHGAAEAEPGEEPGPSRAPTKEDPPGVGESATQADADDAAQGVEEPQASHAPF